MRQIGLFANHVNRYVKAPHYVTPTYFSTPQKAERDQCPSRYGIACLCATPCKLATVGKAVLS